MTREVTTCDICGQKIEVPDFNIFSLNTSKVYKYQASLSKDYSGNVKIFHRKEKLDICKRCYELFETFVREGSK